MADDVTAEWSFQKDNSLSGDYGSIFILLSLYTMQGIPLGISASLPLLLQNYKVTYSQQAIFSLYSWPYSVKLLWAPIVDSVYSDKFGRRKSWIIPIQYLIGLTLFLLSFQIDNLLGPLPKEIPTNRNQTNELTTQVFIDNSSAVHVPSVNILAGIFFFLNFLCATQDVAVDGWALTILSKPNVVYGSICNTIGQTIGFSLGYIVFLALQSPDLCNKYLRSVPSDVGIITISGFLFLSAMVFLVISTLIWIFKRDKPEEPEATDEQPQAEKETIIGTYLMLFKILKLKSIQSFALIILTREIAFAITDSSTSLKLIEAGLSNETLAFLNVPLIPMQIILPWYLSRYTKGRKPLNVFLKVYPFKLICGIIFMFLLAWTKIVYDPISNSFPAYYYFVVILVLFLHRFVLECMFVILLAFFNRISDPIIGGTYMTLLNTISNMAANWPSFISLWLLDYTTFKHCTINGLSCNTKETVKTCSTEGGKCKTTIDGYYIEGVILTLFGILWLKWASKRVQKIQSLPPASWRCSQVG